MKPWEPPHGRPYWTSIRLFGHEVSSAMVISRTVVEFDRNGGGTLTAYADEIERDFRAYMNEYEWRFVRDWLAAKVRYPAPEPKPKPKLALGESHPVLGRLQSIDPEEKSAVFSRAGTVGHSLVIEMIDVFDQIGMPVDLGAAKVGFAEPPLTPEMGLNAIIAELHLYSGEERRAAASKWLTAVTNQITETLKEDDNAGGGE